jgi:DNA-binding transcriptional MerR regulator/effector-binding domain-containing protein
MAELFTVGEFSRLTHLPIKTLHHYHEAGLIEPALVDPATGYRYYAPSLLPAAQLARRLREVRMPLAALRAVLAAPDAAARDVGIAAHLEQLRRELAGTASAVASLQALLTGGSTSTGISYRDAPAVACVAVSDTIDRDDIAPWCARVYPRLYQAAGRLGVAPNGPGGALYSAGWFENGGGSVLGYLPLELPTSSVAPVGATAPGRVRVGTVPAARLAVALHASGYEDLDLTYAQLGRHVLERGIGAEGALRETYLITPDDTADPASMRTEVCWPITEGEPRCP